MFDRITKNRLSKKENNVEISAICGDIEAHVSGRDSDEAMRLFEYAWKKAYGTLEAERQRAVKRYEEHLKQFGPGAEFNPMAGQESFVPPLPKKDEFQDVA